MTEQDSPRARTVGVVMRTKDRAVLLQRALRSVLGQSHPHWKLVVVNDGGDPAPVDALLAQQPDPRIQVLHHPKSVGMEGASNAAIRLLETDLLVIHDDDDSWAPEFLSVCVAELTRLECTHPTIRGVATHCNRVLETVVGGSVEIDQIDPWNGWVPAGALSFSRMLYENFVPPISFVFRRDAGAEVGFFNQALPVLGDWDFMVRFMRRYDVYMIPEVLAFYHHRLTATGAMGNTIVAGTQTHRLYRNLVENAWLRDDFNGKGTGLGLYTGLRTEIEHLRQQLGHIQGSVEHSSEPLVRLRDIQETLYGQLMPTLNQTSVLVERLAGMAFRMRNLVTGSMFNRFIPR